MVKNNIIIFSTDDNARWTDILWRHKDAVVNV